MTHDMNSMRAPAEPAMQAPPPFGTAPADALARWHAAMFLPSSPRFASIAPTSETGDPAEDLNASRAAAARSWMTVAREVPPSFRIDVPGGFR